MTNSTLISLLNNNTFIVFRNGRKVENYKGARNMDDLADFVNTNKEQAGAAGEAAQDGKVPEQKEPETKVKRSARWQCTAG